MSEKKQGFFSKIFGKKESVKVETAPVEEVKKADLQKEPKSKSPKQKAKAKPKTKPKTKPKAKTKPAKKPKPKTEHQDVGPPETTPEWIEEHTPTPSPEPTPTKEPKQPKKKSWFNRLSSGLKRSSDNLSNNITSVFTKKKLDQATLDDLEDICEDYGQIAVYKGSIPEAPHFFDLDDHHHFIAHKPMLVCGNTASMLSGTRLAPHFMVSGDRSRHFGPFNCGQAAEKTESCACYC